MTNRVGKRLIDYWSSHGLPITGGVSERQIDEFETTRQVSIPRDMRDYFLSVNGMPFGPLNDQDRNGFSFLPLEKIRTVAEEAKRIENTSILFPGAGDFFIFCDYLTWCWTYAIHLSKDTLTFNEIVAVGKKENRIVVAESFTEFIDLYVMDSPSLYVND